MDIEHTPGFAVLQTNDQSHRQIVFSEATVVGPGALDPQKADVLVGEKMRMLQASYNTIEDGEWRDEFRGQDGIEQYIKMYTEDDAVRKILTYIFGSIRAQEYYVEEPGDDPEEIRATAFISDQLGLDGIQANKYTMQRLFRANEHKLMFGRGFGEICLQLVDNMAVLDKFITIHPLFVTQMNYDAKGGPKSISVEGTVLGERGKSFSRKIPIEKLVVFVHEDDGDLKGQSILRAAYFPYRIKREMIKLINKGYERFLMGIPLLTAPVGVDSNHPSWKDAEQVAMKFAMNPRSGVVVPGGWTLDVASVNSTMPDALPYIQMMNRAISESMGVDFDQLGKDGNGTGGYGHSSAMMALSDRTIRTYVDDFCAFINTYLIPKLLVQNFPNLKRYPVLKYTNVAQIDASPKLNAIGMLINAAIKKGGAKATTSKASGSKSENFAEGAGPQASTGVSASDSGEGFSAEEFRKIVDELPTEIREMLGFERDRRRQKLRDYRQSKQTAYKKREVK